MTNRAICSIQTFCNDSNKLILSTVAASQLRKSYRDIFYSNDDIPPPLPPHGVPVANSTSTMAITATTTVGNVSNVSNGNNEDYKPPVPPHRNTGVGVRLPEPPRKHRHRASSGGSGGRHGNNRHSGKAPQQSNHHIVKSHGKPRVDNANKKNGEDEEFVELVNHDDSNRHLAKDAGRSREIKRATIVGNPMYSSFSTSAVVSTVVSTVNSSTPTGGAASSTTTSPPSSSPSASSSSSSSSSSCASSSCQEQEESVALDDLNLGMDYNQIMQYFDNLKESNA